MAKNKSGRKTDRKNSAPQTAEPVQAQRSQPTPGSAYNLPRLAIARLAPSSLGFSHKRYF